MLAAALTLAAALWLTVVVATPYLASSGRLASVAVLVYQFGSLICHQRSERSFHLAGMQMPVCARCFGLYAGGAAGLMLAWMVRRSWTPAQIRVVLTAAALPIALSVALELAGAMATTNLFRAMSGMPLGLVAGVVIVGVLRPARN